MKKKYRIVSKVCFTTFVCTLLLVSALSVSSMLGTDQASSMSDSCYTEVQIQSGDTLWNIAKEFCPKDQDLRQAVFKICELNEIQGQQVQPGQRILIPLT